MRLIGLIALTACLAACLPAGQPNGAPDAIRTYRGNLVVPDRTVPGQFEVFSAPGDGPAEFWCAAGIFAEDELNAPSNRRIYVVRPRGPSPTRPGRTSVTFTILPVDGVLQAAEALPQTYALDPDQPGRNLRRIHARMVCRPVRWGPWTP